MSAYVSITTEFRDEGCLLAALKSLGYQVEHHPKGGIARGYQGEEIPAHVIVRRGTHGDVYWEDMAFERTAAGMKAWVSTHYPAERMRELKVAYSTARVQQVAKAKGYTVASETTEGGKVRLVLRRFA